MTDSTTNGEIAISLHQLTKRYGNNPPAVDRLDLEIPRGEIVVLVGSSGCGKSTTLKMINRIIEPTSGRIMLGGEDATTMDPDQLRRRIGYVIQQVGLFPHLTIADNIATVPKLLKWPKTRIDDRVDELLSMVGMDAGYRHRYPKELSGGQQQRIGVARALAADPDVMLMDEPFGAIDPITRDRLQNEFLRIQEEVHKTIVFVTHDIDEAVKMGDRIVIMQEGGRIAQYSTPEDVLTNPANDFVADFIGDGASLKRLNLSRVRDVEWDQWPTVRPDTAPEEAMRIIRESPHSSVLVLDHEDRPRTWVSPRDLNRAQGRPLDRIGTPATAQVSAHATLHDALDEMVTASHAVALVCDRNGGYLGYLDMDRINESIRSMRDSHTVERRRGLSPVAEEASTASTPQGGEAL